MDWKLVHLYDIEENVKFKEIPFESAAEPLLSLVVLSLFFIESQQVIDQISQQRQVFFIQTMDLFQQQSICLTIFSKEDIVCRQSPRHCRF